MNEELIYVEPRQQAVLRYDDAEVSCRNVPEAWLAWAQLEEEEKDRAVIEVGDDTFDAWSIKRLRYRQPEATA
jgi:hypothetical protein